VNITYRVITHWQLQAVQHGLTTPNTDISTPLHRHWTTLNLGQGHAGRSTCCSDQNPCHCSTHAHRHTVLSRAIIIQWTPETDKVRSFLCRFLYSFIVYMFISHWMLLLCLGLLCTSCTIFIIN